MHMAIRTAEPYVVFAPHFSTAILPATTTDTGSSMRVRIFAAITLLALGVLTIDFAYAQAGSGDDYANPDIWLCRPGRNDACTVPQEATVIAADGKLSNEKFTPAKNPPIDCFYVYPTV